MTLLQFPLVYGLFIPFLGTTIGAALIFLIHENIPRIIERAIFGFASGVMIAAAVWSLLVPALQEIANHGKWEILIVIAGFLIGNLAFLFLDKTIPHQHFNLSTSEGMKSKLSKNTKLALAVTLHNIPEGMAVGVAYAAFLVNSETAVAAFALALGIAIQNIPEGTIVSLAAKTGGKSRKRSFFVGFLSGIVEPIAFVVTLIATTVAISILPFLLAFAAGAMMYVVVEELIPDMAQGEHSNIPPMLFAIGFSLMMSLDVLLG